MANDALDSDVTKTVFLFGLLVGLLCFLLAVVGVFTAWKPKYYCLCIVRLHFLIVKFSIFTTISFVIFFALGVVIIVGGSKDFAMTF